MRKFVSAVGNDSGQAVIEYVLLLIVVVSLVLGLRGVFGSMNSFMTDMIGGYVTCLMEYGELPSLGVEDSDLKQHKDGAGKRCPVPRFVASTSFGSGSAGGTGGSTGTSGSANGKNGSNSRGGGKNASKGGDGSDESNGSNDSSRGGGSGSGSRSSVRSRGGSSPYSRGQIFRAGGGLSTADNPNDLNDAAKVKALEDGSDYGYSAGGRRRSRRSAAANAKYRALVGKMAEDVQKNIRTPRKPSSTLLAVDEGFRMTVVKRNFTPPEAKPYVEEKTEEGFTFGNFLKWIIIAGIIIAFFILFGGQVMNYSNSDS